MKESKQAAEPWWNPDLPREEFQRLGYRVIDMLADYYDTLNDRPVFPAQSSAEIAATFKEPLPQTGQPAEVILDEWLGKVLPNATHVGSARYFGFVMGSGSMMATLAEALAAAVNMNAGGWLPGPAATEIERQTIAWLAELVGYPTACGGLLTSGGTMANFTALLTALRNTAVYDSRMEGLQGHRSGRFLVYMSDHEGHVSILRVADMLNLGRNAVRRVVSDEGLRMDPVALEAMILHDRAQGDIPLCVVAQVGSINAGAIDPLDDIADVCARQGVWFHADGACGAFGRIVPEKAEQYRGLERADSVTLDPHKWLFMPYECGCVLVRDPEKLRRAFSLSAPYLQGTLPADYQGLNYFDYGPQMSRGFLALKVWMTLKHYGVDGYRRLLTQGIRCAERLDELVRASAFFEPVHQPNLYMYSFRYVGPRFRLSSDGANVDPEVSAYLDWLNQRIADEIRTSGLAFIMTSTVRGQTVLRLSICSHRTTPADIEAVFARLAEIGRSIDEAEGMARIPV